MSKGKNKGEWSELYVFAKILSERNLVGADEYLVPIFGENYPVLKILRNSKNVRRTYDLGDGSSILVRVEESGEITEEHQISNEVLEEAIPKILSAIKGGKGAFEMLDGSEFALKLSAGNIKTNATKKGDIQIVVYDKVTSMPSAVEFSIKSYIGALPTLVNSSQLTNFTFCAESFSGSIDKINEIETKAKFQDRTKAVIASCKELRFVEVESPTFVSNLRKIDSKMPEIISQYLLAFNSSGITSLEALTQHLIDSKNIDPITGYGVTFEELKYKIKQLFLNFALGMVARYEWDGFIKADGGYIIVKESGEIVCFHIYNISQLSEYLFNNTQLQNYGTKSKYGMLYKEGGEVRFKLNLNVRFTKPQAPPETN